VGGGEDYEALQQLTDSLGIRENVQFCGRVPAEQVVLYYHQATVSVDPVYDDDTARGRSPLKLFESWICGVPYVSGDVGDRRILLGEPPAGLLAKPGDVDSLAAEIIKLFGDPDLSARIIQLGQAKVKEFYWDVLVREFEVWYQTMEKSGN
jgi:glycosyltransferase involved in cell wall biosynthesis